MNPKLHLLYGFIFGIITSFIGCFLFITLFTDFLFIEGMRYMKAMDKMGKVIALGTILNLILFWGLLRFNKEYIARGVVLAVIVITIYTQFA